MTLIVTAQAGLASDTNTWVGGVVPGVGDQLRITHDVELDGHYEWGNGKYGAGKYDADAQRDAAIWLQARLKWSRTVDSSLTTDGQLILSWTTDNTGTIDMGVPGIDEIPDGIKAEFICNATGITADEKRFIHSYNSSSSTSRLPKIYMASAVKRKRNTFLTVDSAAGTNMIEVDDATNWKIGDELVVALSTNNKNSTVYKDSKETEHVEILSITNNIITLVNNLTYKHGFLYIGATDEIQCKVSNLTSNVVVRPKQKNFRFLPIYVRTTLFDIDNVEFQSCNNKNASTRYAPLNLYDCQGVVAYAKIDNSSFWRSEASGTKWTKTMVYFYKFKGTGSFKNCVIAALNLTAQYSLMRTSYGGTGQDIQDCNFYTHNTSDSHSHLYAYQSAIDVKRCAFIGGRIGLDTNNTIGAKSTDCEFYNNYAALNSFNNKTTHIRPKSRFNFRMVQHSANWNFETTIIDPDIQLGPYTSEMTDIAVPLESNAIYLFSNIDADPKQQLIISGGGQLKRETVIIRNNPDSLALNVNANNNLVTNFNIPGRVGKPASVVFYIKILTAQDGEAILTIEEPGSTLGSTTLDLNNLTVNTWQAIALIVSPTKNAVLNVSVNITNNTNQITTSYIADFAAPLSFAAETGSFEFWNNGQPIPWLMSSFVSAADVWNTPDSALLVDGTMGKAMDNKLTTSDFIALN